MLQTSARKQNYSSAKQELLKSQRLSPKMLLMELTILAFRRYSRGYISYHYFVSAEEDCRYKFKLKDQLLSKFGQEAIEARKFLMLSREGLMEI